MEISIDIDESDLVILKKRISTSKLDGDDLDKVKQILQTKKCDVDSLQLLQRLLNYEKLPNRLRIHELLTRSKIQIPALPKPVRSAELEARIQKLRAEQSEREYRDMTRNVDANKAKESPLSEMGREIRSINRHLITLFNMVFTVVGSFVFAYMGTQYLFPTGPAAFVSRLGAGLITATIVFFADLYFVIRTLDEDAYGGKQSNDKK